MRHLHGPSVRPHESSHPLMFLLLHTLICLTPMPSDTRTSVDIGDGWTPLSFNMTLKYTKLSCGIAANSTFDRNRISCHQLAVARKQSEVLRVLKEEGLAVADARDVKTFAVALVLAAGRGHTNNVRCLLNRGVSVNAESSNGSTALYVAAMVGRLEIVELLLHAGAAVDCTDKNYWTPLMVASQEGCFEIVERLVDRHSSLEMQNIKGETALSIAVQCGQLSISRLLLSVGANVNTKDVEGMTPLMFASRSGQLTLVQLLITKGTDLELCCKSGYSALHLAAGNGRLDVVRELLNAGADLMLRDRIKGLTPLMYAAVHGHAYIVKYLLSLSFQQEEDIVETRCNKGCTALYLAASQRQKTVCELLLDEGVAAIDSKDWRGYTPLMIAAKRGYVDIVQVLLSRGANIEAVNADGNRALEIASRSGRTAVVRLLLENGAFVDAPNRTRGYTALSTAALRGRIEVVHLLLSYGANVKAQSIIGDTPLLLAATQGRLEVARLLLVNGAAPYTKNVMGETPLSRAVAGGYVKVATMLKIASETRNRAARSITQVRKPSNNFRGSQFIRPVG